MAANRDTSACSFTSAMALSQMGIRNVPERYILPIVQRPTLDQKPHCSTMALPVIDLSPLANPSLRSRTIEEVRVACKELGVFQHVLKLFVLQVINHGIPLSYTTDALDVAAEFFTMPNETKMHLASSDVCQPVRYGTSLNYINDKVQYWRDFIKHYSHPISTWIDFWPSDPPSYKKKMGNYAKAVHILHKMLMEVVFESLGLRPDHLQKDIEQGSQVMAVNCYPACPEPNLALGLPPHSDYGTLTIILQNQQGLEIMNSNGKWRSVPVTNGALVIQLGDQMEVLSNGRYKTALHRAILNSEKERLSIASLHSLAIDQKVTPASKLVDEKCPLSYKEGSFGDFLQFISDNDIGETRYIDTLRKNPATDFKKQTEL
ncbi:Iron/ascorbate family oxidoreductase [Handroanthus impetiginosus]|uniref:Iron/ascorbate family oxidoreductase n=1 Tax=Handroanthus impetiginosus TaxID=429701 RepID=A0A2G9G8V3_9LAMI|nr:Iron/ascorbate family oxidoreductase [Handroanthus impetiginosus]